MSADVSTAMIVRHPRTGILIRREGDKIRVAHPSNKGVTFSIFNSLHSRQHRKLLASYLIRRLDCTPRQAQDIINTVAGQEVEV